MKNKVFKTIFVFLLSLLLLITPVYALHEETTESTTEEISYSDKNCSLAIHGYSDGSLANDSGVVLKIRNITTGEEYTSTLYNFNDFYDFIQVKQGEFEIYSGYILGGEAHNDIAANIEYVRFRCYGTTSVTIPIVIGKYENVKEEIPSSPARVNPVGEKYLNYPESINTVIRTETGETEVIKETVTVPSFVYSNTTSENSESQTSQSGSTTNPNAAGQLSDPAPRKDISLKTIIIIFSVSVVLILVGIFFILRSKKKRKS